MTKQIINIGTSANKGNGDPLRTAFAKVNANFDELYTALGLNADGTLSLGAFEFTGSVMTTTDSTAITIDQATTVTSNLTVGGDVLPSLANGGNLGSLAAPWNSLYVSNSTIYFGGIPLSVDVNGNLLVNNQTVTGGGGSSVTTGATAPVDPGVGDLWYDTASGRTYVYYDSSWVDANPVDGAGISSTNELVNGAHTVSLGSTGIITLPSSSYLESTDTNLKVGAQGTVTIRSNAELSGTTRSWEFGRQGTIATPLLLPRTFTAVLDNAHRTVGDAISGTPWQYTVAFVVGPGGAVETQIDNPDWPTNPGYSPGDEFEFTEEDHGIPGFTFAVTINGFSEIPGTGFLVVIGVTPPPEYPSTFSSLGAIKLSANTSDWLFDPNGSLYYPDATVQTTAYVAPTTGNAVISSQSSITISRNGMTIKITEAGVVQMSFDSIIDIRGRSSINNAGSTTIATPNGDTVIGTWYDISTALALGDQLVSTIMDSSFHNVYRITVLIREQDTTPGVEFTTAYAIIEQIQ